eukprot:gene31031-biopygen9553
MHSWLPFPTVSSLPKALDDGGGGVFAVKEIDAPDGPDSDRELAELCSLCGEVRVLRAARHPNVVRYLGRRSRPESNTQSVNADLGAQREEGRVYTRFRLRLWATVPASDFVICIPHYSYSHRLYIFMEFMAGGSVAALARTRGGLPPQVVQRYTAQILAGLAYLHSRSPPIVHRDIKGDNMLCEGTSGVVKIADFGTAKRLYLVPAKPPPPPTACDLLSPSPSVIPFSLCHPLLPLSSPSPSVIPFSLWQVLTGVDRVVAPPRRQRQAAVGRALPPLSPKKGLEGRWEGWVGPCSVMRIGSNAGNLGSDNRIPMTKCQPAKEDQGTGREGPHKSERKARGATH